MNKLLFSLQYWFNKSKFVPICREIHLKKFQTNRRGGNVKRKSVLKLF